MNEPLDDRIRRSLHDLDRRVAQSVEPQVWVPRTGDDDGGRGSAVVRHRILAPLAAGIVVVAVLLGIGTLGRDDQKAQPSTPTPTASPAPGPADLAPSQSELDAKRDGVYPQLAQMSLHQRLAVAGDGTRYAEIPTAEGIWTIRHPEWSEDESAPPEPPEGCYEPVDAARSYEFCASGDYNEVLLLSPDRDRILRAFPMPAGLFWLMVTPDAVYCGRSGDGGLPHSTLCRIDRKTLKTVGVVFKCEPGVVDCSDAPRDGARLKKFPGSWRVGPATSGAATAIVEDGELSVRDSFGHETRRVDAVTLKTLTFIQLS